MNPDRSFSNHASIPGLPILTIAGCLMTAACLGLTFLWASAFSLWSSANPSTAQVIEEQTLPPSPPTQDAPAPLDTWRLLETTTVPINDPIDLAQRIDGKINLPTSLTVPAPILQVEDTHTFWIINSDSNQKYQAAATLRYITPHLYFWIQDGVVYEEKALQKLAEAFENQIYPTNREFFGSEWVPGVDNDPHIYILYSRNLGETVAGYFSPADEYLSQVRPDVNGHEMFLLNAERVSLSQEHAYSVLAHEFQHMIHWYRDRNEETWMNEGFSNVAVLINNYRISGADIIYASKPDIQLTDWASTPEQRSAHYGASFLFLTYFLSRFGAQTTQALVAEAANGMSSIDLVLARLNAIDPLTHKPTQADDVFADWVLASYLHNPTIGDERYTYTNYPKPPQPAKTEIIGKKAGALNLCPGNTALTQPNLRDVSQYGVDYISITCPGNYTLHFEGSTQVKVLPTDPHSGEYAFYSNRGDSSDMTLTRTFDFTNHSGPLTLTYWTWYDLEKDYDYLYLLASLDGKTWKIITTPSGTAENPAGNSYGWSYNGISGGGAAPTLYPAAWIQESIDISQFAGKQVQLRFEYVTDAAVNGNGFLIDDIAIPEINYFADFEEINVSPSSAADGGWQANGFVRIQNFLPQYFRLSLITYGDQTTVTYLPLQADNSLDIPLQIDGDVREVVLVVSGVTRFTTQKAAYQFTLLP